MVNRIWWRMKWIVIICVLTLCLIVVSCNQDSKDTPSTSLVSGGKIENFFRIGTGSSEQYIAYKEQESFLINIPVVGHYRMIYTTNPGDFELVFRVAERSLIRAQLQAGNEIHDVALQKGTIIDAPPNISQVVEVFEDYSFEMDSTFGTRILIKDGEEFIPTPTPAPTPTPVPTSTPTTAYDENSIIIAAIGDSITYGQNSLVGGYPPMLESRLQDDGYTVRVLNNGIPGARAEETDANFEHLTNGANIVLIMIGTNNVIDSYGCPAPFYCHASEHIRSMVDKARQAGITPLVSTVPPINSTSSYSWANSHVRQLNTQIYADAGTTIVDIYNAIRSQGGDALFSDALHFNDQGYDVIAREWYNALVSGNIVK